MSVIYTDPRLDPAIEAPATILGDHPYGGSWKFLAVQPENGAPFMAAAPALADAAEGMENYQEEGAGIGGLG